MGLGYYVKIIFLALVTICIKFINNRFRISKCLVGKTALVTGANQGIGYEICLSLASRGCTVIMASRSDPTTSMNLIIKETGNTNVIGKRVDLSSLRSVREFANDINKNVKKLDILVNNAGISKCKNKLTEDGLNPVMQVNAFGHFLLTHLLLDLLQKSGPSRILFATSLLCLLENIDLNNLNRYSVEENYSDSKMAMLVASDYFAEKLKHTPVTSNAYHPGIVMTNIFENFNLKEHGLFVVTSILLLKMISWPLGKRAWEAAEQTVHLAVSDEFEKTSGAYFFEGRKFLKPSRALDPKFKETLMKTCKFLVKID